MNATSSTDSLEPKPLPPRSFWRMEAPRWFKWYLGALILTVFALAATLFYFHHSKPSDDKECAFFAVTTTVTYMLALAACVKVFVKDK